MSEKYSKADLRHIAESMICQHDSFGERKTSSGLIHGICRKSGQATLSQHIANRYGNAHIYP